MSTTTSTSVPTNAIIRKLSKPTVFECVSDRDRMDLTLYPGDEYQYERVDMGDEIVHIAFVIEDGERFESVVRMRKQQTTQATQSAPVQASKPAVAVPTQVQNAIEGTAQAVHSALSVMAGKQSKELDEVERSVRHLERTRALLVGKVFQVNYYIPEELKYHAGTKTGVRNPSRIFRLHGFRLDGSNWVMPEAALAHKDVVKVFKEFSEASVVYGPETIMGRLEIRCEIWSIEYTQEQLAAMRDKALGQLANRLREVHTSLITRIDSAAKSLDEAKKAQADKPETTQKDRERTANNYASSLRSLLSDAFAEFEHCLRGAELFDDTGSLDALFSSLRGAIRTEALAINATLEAQGRKPVDIVV